MSFLPNPIELYKNETLESALLRLCRANHFEHYNDLSLEIRAWLEEHHPTVAGAFPLALDAVNVYHAKQSSAKRVQALQLLEQLVGLPQFSLLDISFKHTTSVDTGTYAEVRYKQSTFPRVFLRNSAIPVCVECLKEANYARFDWHITKVSCCEKHRLELLHHCPACHVSLNYMLSEDPSKCICGHDLLNSPKQPVGVDTWRSWSFEGSHGVTSLSEQLATLVLLERHFPAVEYDDFKSNPQGHIQSFLRHIIDTNLQLATSKINHLPFSQITNNFLNETVMISSLPIELRSIIADTVIHLALDTPRSSVANIGDSLISIREATTLTGSNIDDLYRLYENGILILGKRVRSDGRLESFNPVFRLRDVASLALSYSRLGYSQSSR